MDGRDANAPSDTGGPEVSNEFTTFGYPLGLMFSIPYCSKSKRGGRSGCVPQISPVRTARWAPTVVEIQEDADAIDVELRLVETARILKAIQVSRKYQPDAFIAVGGGSVIDTVKMMNLFAPLKLVIARNHDFTMDITAFEARLAEARQPLHPEIVAREYGTIGQASQHLLPRGRASRLHQPTSRPWTRSGSEASGAHRVPTTGRDRD
ncbi:hypothetical protein Z517_09222 [Fonsecaea pedrosoi CBS 271.37]|uniref:Alcohol dehydrogenase iron-type/glycerol dehydrogenase GldA domain-containing protein n=1 Tax=Fonsecaea pedrosoi CBS 271.37 TaxID=1442368 RepID=A0A0D2G7W8_9EURO|nr:uncharacterized protein Z517_09222 [Fonsecaea pedrosoi CBS 271.37]KIW76778.1 hypothetical protein Z517_09222 [Fonsecaea pedrosoi CBS 271.37]